MHVVVLRDRVILLRGYIVIGFLKTCLVSRIRSFGYEVIGVEEHKRLMDFVRKQHPIGSLWSVLTDEKRKVIHEFHAFSKSQLAQDLFVLSELGVSDRGGFFVEFGATDGVSLSNSWLLEKKLNWRGILVEPAKIWIDNLKANRTCQIDIRCVSNTSGDVIEFLEANSAELSGILKHVHASDWAGKSREINCKKYNVETVSLSDLLEQHSAPEVIDFLSVDTEGSEFSILSAVDFNKWKFRVITVEHNYCEPLRSKIRALLLSNGYIQRHPEISKWDDWYIHQVD